MANLNGFDASTVEPAIGFDPIPAGNYLAAITSSQMKPTKSGNGNYLELTFQILESEFKGRSLWSRLNLDNPKPETVKFARAELSSICRAVGVMTPKDSSDLHNIPLVITVGHQKRKDTDEISNVLKSYARRNGSASTASPAAKPAADRAPWMR